MDQNFHIQLVTEANAHTQQCLDSLWEEIQTRYEFQAPNPMVFSDFLPPNGKFFIAIDHKTNDVLGSAAYSKFSELQCELDAVFVFPKYRKKKVATALLVALENQAGKDGYSSMILRAGNPQPEALQLYKNFGFKEIPTFGKWVSDPTAVCFEKKIH
ncbi:GNAT family N-acetyltransferase [Leptospira jelokensis]|uniref:GNAT family N-acetyltransferase n=1 Tax=Leptospira jelokensis TaxID=2484931 RepID=UPI001090C04F|nr:GNAT family N-acetyltransferase [Leptospira jelokensis]TGM05435.1 GNAT family N-acetyltransferase [Leptospira jelokensis]